MIIRTDASKCIHILQGYSFFNNGMDDFWYYSDTVFKTGRSYALVSEYQQGCMYLSYLLGGQIEIKDGLEIKPTKGVQTGFRLASKDGSGYFDCSDDGIMEMLMPYFRDLDFQ